MNIYIVSTMINFSIRMWSEQNLINMLLCILQKANVAANILFLISCMRLLPVDGPTVEASVNNTKVYISMLIVYLIMIFIFLRWFYDLK